MKESSDGKMAHSGRGSVSSFTTWVRSLSPKWCKEEPSSTIVLWGPHRLWHVHECTHIYTSSELNVLRMHFGASERKEGHAIESSKRSQKKSHILNMSGILASKCKFLATLFFFCLYPVPYFFFLWIFHPHMAAMSSHWSTWQNAFSAPFYRGWLTNSGPVGLGFLERDTVGLTVPLHTRSWSKLLVTHVCIVDVM